MKRLIGRIYAGLCWLGFDAKVFLIFFREYPGFVHDFRRLKRQREAGGEFPLGSMTPILNEKVQESGSASGAYFHQDLLVARKIFNARPRRHVDIGSRVDGFVAHVAVFMEIEVLDIRAQHSSVRNIIFKQCDMMHLPQEMVASCDSVSSLHAIEHFGLGRYGDPVDYNGHLKAIDSIYRLLRPKGMFYFAVPIGKQRIEFNAHRVFDVSYLLKVLAGRFRVLSFSYVNDNGDLVENAPFDPDLIHGNFGCRLGCGIFELVKV